MSPAPKRRVVYIVGAGLSAGLGFPTIRNLLPSMWERIATASLDADLRNVIRFHHPNFNPALTNSYPDVEQFLSEMEANAQLFDSSRPATGNFTSLELEARREAFLLELANWFHELQSSAVAAPPTWFAELIQTMKSEHAQIISFNWDLVLDQQLFGTNLVASCYGFGQHRLGPRLLKPHGSLNWYAKRSGRFISNTKKFSLAGDGPDEVFAFKEYRAPRSSSRRYMPLIVPPGYLKDFKASLFKQLWQEVVAVLSTASEVRFLGYSLPIPDIHARFILRCGFHNQEYGELQDDGSRAPATGRAKVTIVDPNGVGPERLHEAVGWSCDWKQTSIQEWVEAGGLK